MNGPARYTKDVPGVADIYPTQTALLDDILASDCILANELPAVPEIMRSPKKATPSTGGLFDFEEEG